MFRKILFAALAGLAPCLVHAEEVPATPAVYVVPVDGPIEPALLYVVRRGIDEAVRNHAAAIVFQMDTPGGQVNAAEGIVNAITRTTIPTYTFVEHNAFSAGALIALSTKHIYMAPGSVIGAATPLMMGPGGGVQDLPGEVKEKMTSAVAALARSAAEQGGHDKRLAEAMVRADMEYRVDGTVISPKGRLLTLTNTEAERPVGDPPHPLLSEGTVKDIDGLLQAIGLPAAETRVLRVTAAERLARLIARIAPFLMMIGLGGIWLEIKTPGFGVFGITGIACLLLYFFGSHIAGLAGMEDLLLFFAGLVLLAIEIFAIPGFGITGMGGLLLILLSLVGGMIEHLPGSLRPVPLSMESLSGPLVQVGLAFVGSLALAFLAGRFLPESRAFGKLALGAVVPPPGERQDDLLGAEGVARSDLRPGGTAIINGRRVAVLTRGDYVARGTPVRVVDARGNRIVVEGISRG